MKLGIVMRTTGASPVPDMDLILMCDLPQIGSIAENVIKGTTG